MNKKILIMGLPGSGKTTLSKSLKQKLDHCIHLNADEIRKEYNDWDFSVEGRLRQANRMSSLADEHLKKVKHVICDFVCPTNNTRNLLNPDYVIFMNTINRSIYEDTNNMFEVPKFDFEVTHKDAEMYSFLIKQDMIK